jgi:predicted GNAT family acetyltransferase
VRERVVDNPERSRFEIYADDDLAGFAAYERGEGVIDLTHTEIKDRFEGMGLGSSLITFALAAAREEGLGVIPHCPFVRSWIERHPDYVPLVPEERRAEFGL